MNIEDTPEELYTPCCTYLRTGITFADRGLLVRTGKIARALHGWGYRLYAFPPHWHLYIEKEKLTDVQVASVREGTGPVVVLSQILTELEKYASI